MTARILGILAGTFISLLVAVLVYPISATEECMIGIKRAFRGLSHLNKAAIQEGRHALGKARDDMDEPQDDVADRFVAHAPLQTVCLSCVWTSILCWPLFSSVAAWVIKRRAKWLQRATSKHLQSTQGASSAVAGNTLSEEDLQGLCPNQHLSLICNFP